MRRTALLSTIMAAAVMLAGGAAFAAAGQLDRTFSGDGKVVTDLKGGRFGQHEVRDVIVQPDGKLVAAGATFSGTGADYALARFSRR